MKILLIQAPWYGFQNIISGRLYLGLAYLAAVLDKEEHQVQIFNGETFFKNIINQREKVVINEEDYLKNFNSDHKVYKEIMSAVRDFGPDIVGISFMTANSTSGYYLAEMLKNYKKDLPLIAGGTHSTLIPEEPLKKAPFDFVIRGEGEETIADLINTIQNKKDISKVLGISYLKDGKIINNPNRPFIQNLDKLPFPSFHLMKDAQKNLYACTGITTARGCPFQCNYCASNLMWTRNVRFRTPANVVEEIRDRHNRLGVKNYSFNDDTFTLKSAFVEEICKMILDLPFKIKWHCDTRGDTINLKTLKLMKKAGCNHIYLGLESGSPKIQKMIKKNIDNSKIKTAVKLARKAGIETTVYFMAGFPEETEEDLMQSVNAMKDIKPDHAIWSILTPYPGTEIWDLAQKQGLVSLDTDWTRFFHHSSRNFFNTISKESWEKMLKIIENEQNKLNGRMTFIKFKKKIHMNINLAKIAIRNPGKVFKQFKKIPARFFKKR